MAHITVTGAAGFVGSVFALGAKKRGHEVVALDNFARGLNDLSRFGITIREWDCWNGLPQKTDVVVHLAAATGSLSRPLSDLMEQNVGMLQRVFADCYKYDAKMFWPTTSLALGVPNSPYCISKEAGLEWARQVPHITPLRFFNVAGSHWGLTERRKDEVHLLPVMVQCAKEGDTFVINGGDYPTIDGTPSRDFISVCDVCSAIFAMIDGAEVTKEPDGAVWLGTGVSTTVGTVLQWARDLYPQLSATIGPRRPFDTHALHCPPHAAEQVRRLIGRPLEDTRKVILAELKALGGFDGPW